MGGNKRLGCYALAVTIFSLGIFRDFLYERALRDQPSHPLLESPLINVAAYGLIAGGNVLVLTSMWALGVTGTYLGDYFGILMDHMVTGFPFNVTSAPMYYGSFMSFIGSALLYNKPAGVLLSAEVLIMYLIALQFEEYVLCLHSRQSFLLSKFLRSMFAVSITVSPTMSTSMCNLFSKLTVLNSPFTAEIYAKRERERQSAKGKSKKTR